MDELINQIGLGNVVLLGLTLLFLATTLTSVIYFLLS